MEYKTSVQCRSVNTQNITDIKKEISLRSKRFQSSYSAKFEAGAKKKMEGGGGREERKGSFTPLPLPLHSFFCSRSSFLDELARNRLLRRLKRDKKKKHVEI